MVGSARQATRTLRALQVRRLYLWPRYREEVKACLVHEPEVIELHQPLSPAMAAIHAALSDIIAVCLKDLRKTHIVSATLFQSTVGFSTNVAPDGRSRAAVGACSLWQVQGHRSKTVVHSTTESESAV